MIMDILKFIFSDFWIWLGTAIMLSSICNLFHGIIEINKTYIIEEEEIDKEEFIKELIKIRSDENE